MNIQILLGDQLEQMSINQIVDNKTIPVVVNKLVNPTLVFRSPFIPGAIDMAIIAATHGLDTSINHDTTIAIKNKMSGEILAITTNIQIPANMFKLGEGINLNCEFKKVITRTEGEYEVVFNLDGTDYTQNFFVTAIEKL